MIQDRSVRKHSHHGESCRTETVLPDPQHQTLNPNPKALNLKPQTPNRGSSAFESMLTAGALPAPLLQRILAGSRVGFRV